MSTTALPARFAQLRVRDLMLLEHLEELGSLTDVAARMHVTQSAITQALQSLEEAFGRSLVARRRPGQRGVHLTPAGTAALMHLRVARHELEAALTAAADPGTLELRIGALPLTLVQPLPDALARLRKRLPQVHVRLSEATVPALWRQLEAGEFDAIVCRLPALSEQPRLPEGLEHRTVGHESLVLVCGRGHPIARTRKPTLARLRAYDWVLPPEGSYTRLAIEQRFMRAGLAAPRAAVTSMNFHANLRLAAEGSLLAVVPRSAALAVRKVLDLSVFMIDWVRDDTPITLVWRQASLGNPALVTFLECF
jgi:DNA-binding transcriptional LysR family regulator